MSSRDFCYWLQGFFEIGHPITITPEQTACIKNHLAMVFRHEIDPSHGNKQHVEELRKIHEGKPASESPKEAYPDGAAVVLPKALTDVLPKDWPLDSIVKMNC